MTPTNKGNTPLFIFPTRYEAEGYNRLTIEYVGKGKWVVRSIGCCLNRKSYWENEPLPSSRTDEFKKRTRFNFETAMKLFKKQLEKL